MMDFWIDNWRGGPMLFCMARKLRLEYPGAIYLMIIPQEPT
jgi:hypothetical protein